ncbi:protein of unknown function [Micropruina glycogenica]|uniref:Uncharacterized protein n=1 Tax=Micropruina glycogenica TaxID=75385 RepID=A0A2N9JMH1_9ACTN|nr:protein of unknown function [Micropruina glycogenica]
MENRPLTGWRTVPSPVGEPSPHRLENRPRYGSWQNLIHDSATCGGDRGEQRHRRGNGENAGGGRLRGDLCRPATRPGAGRR